MESLKLGTCKYTNTYYNCCISINRQSGKSSTIVIPPLVLLYVEMKRNAHGVTLHQINWFNVVIDVICLHFT